MKQETVEICEFFGISPYELISSGAMLMAARDGNQLVLELQKAGIPAVVIGKATVGNDRVLLNGEERRFLNLQRRMSYIKCCKVLTVQAGCSYCSARIKEQELEAYNIECLKRRSRHA